jgi:hypothetical protein
MLSEPAHMCCQCQQRLPRAEVLAKSITQALCVNGCSHHQYCGRMQAVGRQPFPFKGLAAFNRMHSFTPDFNPGEMACPVPGCQVVRERKGVARRSVARYKQNPCNPLSRPVQADSRTGRQGCPWQTQKRDNKIQDDRMTVWCISWDPGRLPIHPVAACTSS